MFFAACNGCAGIICDTELEACSADATCFGATEDDLGEYGCMLDCIAETRDVFDCLADGTVTPGSAWSPPTNSNCTAECFGAGNN